MYNMLFIYVIKNKSSGRMRNVSVPPRSTWRRNRVRPGRPQAYEGRLFFVKIQSSIDSQLKNNVTTLAEQ